MKQSEPKSSASDARPADRSAGSASQQRSTLADSAAAAAEKQAEAVLSDAKRSATAAVGDASEAVDKAASVFASHGQETLSQAAGALSRRLENLASYFETRSLDDLTREARTLAAQNPALFIAGGVAVGFALSRFLKASSATSERHAADGGARFDSSAVGGPSGRMTEGSPSRAARPDEGELHG